MIVTQPVLQKKICMLDGFSVGKTSLVKRFVESVFSETYLTTVDQKTVDLGERAVNLILWDVAGEDDVSTLRMTYLRGCAGMCWSPTARARLRWRWRCRCASASKRIMAVCHS
jgi:GTPase SAR1 family protein